MIDKQVDKATDKLPSFDQFKKHTGSAVGYAFMVVFFFYFMYTEFWKKDDCGQRIATLERVLKKLEEDNMKKDERISSLEVALDIRNGVIKEVESSVGGTK